jgi:hypothetical protein
MPSAQTTYPSASTATAYPVPPAAAAGEGRVGVLGRGDIPIQGRGIVDVPTCITVEVL